MVYDGSSSVEKVELAKINRKLRYLPTEKIDVIGTCAENHGGTIQNGQNLSWKGVFSEEFPPPTARCAGVDFFKGPEASRVLSKSKGVEKSDGVVRVKANTRPAWLRGGH